MPRTLNLTGFQTGDNLRLSVSQGAITAGPVNVPSWGGFGDGGPININVHRTIYQVAPDSVRFTVDLDSSNFDTAGPKGDEVYDARLHDLIFLWDFDDAESGDWTAPENVLPEWKDRNVAKGPFVAHMYTTPGTYSPSVMVIEPSSGKISTATVSTPIVVAAPNVLYGDSGALPDTIVINPVGDSDFSDKPAGAHEVNFNTVLSAKEWWYPKFTNDNRPKRILFKRGASYNMQFDLYGSYAGMYFGDYGNPGDAKPIINAIPSSNARLGLIHSDQYYATELVDGDSAPDLRLSNLDFRGVLDPTVTWPTTVDENQTVGCWLKRASDWIISNCDFSGLKFAASFNPSSWSLTPGHLHFDNCTMTAFGGQYPVFASQTLADNGSVTFTGCRFVQTSDAIDNDLIDDDDLKTSNAAYGTRAIVRTEWAQFNHVRGCDFYITDSTQPPMKLIGTPWDDGAIVNVHSNSFEGGSYALWLAVNSTQGIARSVACNVVLDGNIYVGAYNTGTFLSTRATGVTVRNTLLICPHAPRITAALVSLIDTVRMGIFDPNVINTAPIRAFNNTIAMLRTSAQHGGSAFTVVRDVTGDGAVPIVSENNIVHQPNLDTPVTTYAPLDDAQILWTPRCPGYRDAGTKELHTEYATPLDTVVSYRPLPGSPALGAALSGDVSYMDITLRNRPEPPSIGAWEME